MLFLGLSAGLPLLLIFSTLSLWLREAGIERSAVTFFSWAALGYSFKFVWAPLVDKLPIPYLTAKLGRRRSWLILAQIMIIISILSMAFIDPASSPHSLVIMALAAVLLGLSSATQDISIDAFRIESAEEKMQAVLASTYIAGYRLAMIISGAGALFLASALGTTKEHYYYPAWKWTYIAMASCMLLGVITTLLRPEPQVHRPVSANQYSTKDYMSFFFLFLVVASCFGGTFFLTANLAAKGQMALLRILGSEALSGLIIGFLRFSGAIFTAIIVALIIKKSKIINTKMLIESYVGPIQNFFGRYNKTLAWSLLALIGLYRVSDIVLGVISNVFYQDLGFSKNEIAGVVNTFGVFMTLIGGFIGGVFTLRFGIMKMLFWGAFLSAATNMLFILLSKLGHHLPMLYVVISADNLSAGLASAAFVAFLSGLTDTQFTAVQYAIFASLMTLAPKLLGGYSGSMVDSIGYDGFFLLTTLMGAPVLALIWSCSKQLKSKPPVS